MPTIIAMPTVMPTRCPTPMSASDRLALAIAPPAPTRNAVEASAAMTLRFATRLKAAALSAPTMMTRRPALFSSTEPDSSPTLSTSAAATPSG